ncbi:hypothetical protein E2562_015316 [Oryza meyeriana var. granulata]|uniref:Uncharacterized protein n=1 Tax=Oryza meyeriana var. granulata TaxID=110450 RepID=A0A6G1DKJ7_9ORYZ|nr:hypothetical protein E2562_015316 [Oryza meyeriana var. granulata]
MWPDGGLRGNGEMELGEALGEEGEMQGLGVGRRPGTGLRSGCEMEAGCDLRGDAEIRGLGAWMRPGTRLHGDDLRGCGEMEPDGGMRGEARKLGLGARKRPGGRLRGRKGEVRRFALGMRPGTSKHRGVWWKPGCDHPLQEGVDIVLDTEDPYGDELVFIPDSDEDADDVAFFSDSEYVPESEEQQIGEKLIEEKSQKTASAKGSVAAKEHVGKANAWAAELVKQVKKDMEAQTVKKRTWENRANDAEKKVQDLTAKIDAVISGHLNGYVKPAINTSLQKTAEKSEQAKQWADPHVETAKLKWVPVEESVGDDKGDADTTSHFVEDMGNDQYVGVDIRGYSQEEDDNLNEAVN